MIVILTIVLFILMLLVGGDRGAKSFISLACNIILLILAIYLITSGVNPVLVTVIGTILFCQITLIYQNGHSIKTYAATISVVIVVCILSLFVFCIGSSAKFGGYNELDLTSEISMYLSSNVSINMNQLMICTIIISLLGAIMDTAMAITSALFEFNVVNEKLTFSELVKLGFNVGRDILGTTVNTIFFASIGETLMMSILFIKFKYTLSKLVNSKAFFQDVAMMAISNIGCLLIIPISIFICAYMLKSEHKINIKIKGRIDKYN